MGDSLRNLREAREAIVEIPGVKPPILTSPIFETDPVDCEPGAGKFLNAVMEIEFNGNARELLAKLRGIEVAMGRPEKHARNVSRKIDIDLLYFGGEKFDNPELQLPHPRMHQRRFVLEPLAEIRPELVLPGQTKTVRELLASADDSAKVVRLTEEWQ